MDGSWWEINWNDAPKMILRRFYLAKVESDKSSRIDQCLERVNSFCGNSSM